MAHLRLNGRDAAEYWRTILVSKPPEEGREHVNYMIFTLLACHMSMNHVHELYNPTTVLLYPITNIYTL